LPKPKKIGAKGTLNLGHGSKKMALPLFHTHYQGETQDDGIEFSLDASKSKTNDLPIEPI
jgi:hypothetical protein